MLPALRLQVPVLMARVGSTTTASVVARLIASGAATAKADLVRATGLSRSTVDAGLHTLMDLGAVRVVGLRETTGRGRPAELLELDPAFGVVVVLDFGARTVRIAVADLGQHVHEEVELPVRLADGPATVLDAVIDRAERMLDVADLGERYRIAVVGVPGPVDARSGTVVRPPIMPGWDGYGIVAHVRRRLGSDVVVANDVNLRALGEVRASAPDGPLLYIKVGTGIGAGLTTAHGDLMAGANGAAGDIGHLRLRGSGEHCRCGQVGCLEAVASLAALARSDGDDSAAAITRFVARLRGGDETCRAMVVDSAEAIGEIVADLVHFYNPSRVLLGGDLAAASPDLLAGVRGVVYERALPLATRSLTIEVAPLGARAGVAGAIVLGIEQALDARRLAQLAARRRSRTGARAVRLATPAA